MCFNKNNEVLLIKLGQRDIMAIWSSSHIISLLLSKVESHN